jgi:hypothetical protein
VSRPEPTGNARHTTLMPAVSPITDSITAKRVHREGCNVKERQPRWPLRDRPA